MELQRIQYQQNITTEQITSLNNKTEGYDGVMTVLLLVM